jgi:NAD(P)H-hydrate epimerase
MGEPQRQIVLRAIGQELVPVVIDADALNAVAATPNVQLDLRASTVLTPHLGEFRRLARALCLDEDPTEASQRRLAAEALSRRLGCVTVLKGHGTVVSDGLTAWECSAGGPVLATAGSGDVLTGLLAGLIAQFAPPAAPAALRAASAPPRSGGGVLSLFDCARLAVEIHARAADRWAVGHGDAGMLATDLLDALPHEVAAHRAGEGG